MNIIIYVIKQIQKIAYNVIFKINFSAKYTLTQQSKILIYITQEFTGTEILITESQCYRLLDIHFLIIKICCVNCVGNHLTSDYKKHSDSPTKCCNCLGDYSTNYSKCTSKIFGNTNALQKTV